MIVAWALAMVSGFIDTLVAALPDGSGSSSGVITQGPVVNFLVNFGYYLDLAPMLYIFAAVSLFFVAFLTWRIVLMIYNLIPILR